MDTVTQPSFAVDIEDIEYLRHGDQPLLMRLYKPRGAGPFPIVVNLHGGAWCKFDRTNDHVVNEPIAKTGVIIAALDFRMPPQAAYPASMQDINYGVRWLKKNAANFKGDASRIAISGSSSGGHQAILNGMRPRDVRYSAIPLRDGAGLDASVQGVILCSPVICPQGRYQYAQRLKANPPYPESVDLWIPCHHDFWGTEAAMSEGSPVCALERGEKSELPPVLYLSGTNDKAHPRVDLDRFVTAYRKAGGRVDLRLYEGEAEGFMNRKADGAAAQRAREAFANFVRNEMK